MSRLIEALVKRSLLVNLLSLFVLIVGVIVFFQIRREAFPLVYLDIVWVQTLYPGATPEEIEKLVTDPVERAIKEVDSIEKVQSISVEGLSNVIVQIDPDARNKEKIKNDIQRAIDRITDLPVDSERPNVIEVATSQTPVIEVLLSGSLPEEKLRQFANTLEEEIERVSDVGSVSKRGYRDREMWVEVDPEKLSQFELSLQEIVDSLRLSNVNLTGGNLESNGLEQMIRTVSEYQTPEDIEKVIIRSNYVGYRVQVRDVAKVMDTFERETIREKSRGTRSISLVVLKKERGDILSVVDNVKRIVENFKKSAPAELKINYANDLSFYVKRRLNILYNNAWFGFFLVIICLLLFLSPAISFMTALGIPFAFFAALIVMHYFNMTINLISMFGLIIVLGMLVDDSIVIAENIHRYLEMGYSPRQAASIGASSVAKPVLATVTTTIVAFLPLAFMSGVMGKFIVQIPIVVSICLTASLFEAFFCLPSHCADFVRPQKNNKKNQKEKNSWLYDRLLKRYIPLLQFALKWRYMGISIVFFLFLGSVYLAKNVMDFVLFPPHGIEIFFIRAEKEMGASLENMSRAMEPLEQLVSHLPKDELDNFLTMVGISQDNPQDPFTKRGTHIAQIIVYLTPEQKRVRKADEIIADLRTQSRNIKGFTKVAFSRVTPGPPVGKPVAAQVVGDDFASLQQIADRVKIKLGQIAGVKDIEDDFQYGKEEIRVVVDEAKAARAGLTPARIASTLRIAFEGGVATKMNRPEEDEEIHIVVKFPEGMRQDKSILEKLFIPNIQNQLVPLNKVASFSSDRSLYYIRHHNYKRLVTVSADVDRSQASVFKVNKALDEEFKDISHEYLGTQVSYGGEQEETQKSLQSLFRAFWIAALLIFLILAATFESIIQPFVVMLTIPFGLIGVVATFLFHGLPFSFMSLLGMVGLSGVVVNDAIILVDFINQLRKEGLPIREAVIQASQVRLRAVVLTTITTVAGLGPVAYGIGGNDPILRPAALAIAWGLFFATALTLLVIPMIYCVAEDIQERIKSFRWMQAILKLKISHES